MTQRPKSHPDSIPAPRVTPEDLHKIREAAFRRERDKIVARVLSIVFGTIAVALIAGVAVEIGRVRALEATRDDCRAAAAQLPDPKDRIALIVGVPACAPVVDVARSR